MAEREAEDWLLRYLVVLVFGVVALLALLYSVLFEWSLAAVVASVIVLAAIGALVTNDLRGWRTV